MIQNPKWSLVTFDTSHVAYHEAELELKHNHFENWKLSKRMIVGLHWSPLGATQSAGLVHNIQRLLICQFFLLSINFKRLWFWLLSKQQSNTYCSKAALSIAMKNVRVQMGCIIEPFYITTTLFWNIYSKLKTESNTKSYAKCCCLSCLCISTMHL